MARSATIIPRKSIEQTAKRWHRSGKKVVFTNGVFDIIHRGHVEYLQEARRKGDMLVVGLNSDASVRRLKGAERPLQKQQDRAIILLALEAVDYVVFFSEDTPLKLIGQIRPDVLVKGADYSLASIVGAELVRSYGGKVHRIRLRKGRSSTRLIRLLEKV